MQDDLSLLNAQSKHLNLPSSGFLLNIKMAANELVLLPSTQALLPAQLYRNTVELIVRRIDAATIQREVLTKYYHDIAPKGDMAILNEIAYLEQLQPPTDLTDMWNMVRLGLCAEESPLTSSPLLGKHSDDFVMIKNPQVSDSDMISLSPSESSAQAAFEDRNRDARFDLLALQDRAENAARATLRRDRGALKNHPARVTFSVPEAEPDQILPTRAGILGPLEILHADDSLERRNANERTSQRAQERARILEEELANFSEENLEEEIGPITGLISIDPMLLAPENNEPKAHPAGSYALVPSRQYPTLIQPLRLVPRDMLTDSIKPTWPNHYHPSDEQAQQHQEDAPMFLEEQYNLRPRVSTPTLSNFLSRAHQPPSPLFINRCHEIHDA